MACVYILFSKSTNKFYIGASRENGAEQRLVSHNKGSTRSTRFGRPWMLLEIKTYSTYTEARRELFLKSGVGRKYIMDHFGNIKS